MVTNNRRISIYLHLRPIKKQRQYFLVQSGKKALIKSWLLLSVLIVLMGDQFAIPRPKTSSKIVQEENPDLVTYKREVALYSLKRAAVRVHSLQAKKLAVDPIKEEEIIQEVTRRVRNYDLSVSEFADTTCVAKGQLSPDEKFYTTVGWSGECKVWTDLDCPRVATVLLGHKYQVFDVDYHPSISTNDPDTPNIVTGGADCMVRLWTFDMTESKQNCLELSGHEDRVNKTKFHPNGLHIVSASYDKTVMLWDIDKEKVILKLLGHQASIHAMSIHPDGSLIVE